MSEVYAARMVARKHIVEQFVDCNVKKNSNGLYNHDNIIKAKETIEGKLKEVFWTPTTTKSTTSRPPR